MAYSFFPKTKKELAEGIKSFRPTDKTEIASLFDYLKKEVPLDAPINIDKAKPRVVNVSRAIDGTIDLKTIQKNAGLKNVKIKYGNGSSGNRGVNNRGNLFEPQFADALMKWWDGEKIANKDMEKAIMHLDETYNMRKSKMFKVDVVGGENTKRPLSYSGNKIEITNPKGTGTDIGKSVTDITITLDKRQEIYLSLKLGTTVTFFNVGVRTVLTPQEIQNYEITNKDGKQLLKLFGIDEYMFCDVFNGTMKSGYVDQNADFDRNGMKKLLTTGIGEGYHVIHKLRGGIVSKQMDKKALQKAAQINQATVFYGGKTGTGKRIDVEMMSPLYNFKLNIRDTQGKDGYPTRLMCDFTYR